MSDPPRRRRRGVATTDVTAVATKVVTTAVVAYGAYRLVDWAYTSWWSTRDGDDAHRHHHTATVGQHQSRSSTAALTARRRRDRQKRLLRCQRECWQAWQALGSSTTLSPVLTPATDTTAATNRIKALRAAAATTSHNNANNDDDEQSRLWHQVKIRSITRWIATAYAQSLLMLVLTVQTNLWGAQLWHEQQQQQQQQTSQNATVPGSSAAPSGASTAEQRMQSYQQQHQAVLQQTFGYFFQMGLAALVECVTRATEQVLMDWNVTDKAYLHLSRVQIMEAVDEIRTIVEERQAKRKRTLWRFFVPPLTAASAGGATMEESEILAETWDWLESPLLQDALEDTLRVTFTYAAEVCFRTPNEDSSSTPQQQQYSLAQLLPKIKKNAARLHASQDNPLLERVHQLPSVQEIGNLCFR
eukprot:scaffold569_cov165-Amphora_coffeaeformis.AAC.13